METPKIIIPVGGDDNYLNDKIIDPNTDNNQDPDKGKEPQGGIDPNDPSKQTPPAGTDPATGADDTSDDFVEGDQVEIDGAVYTIDKEGNAIDDKGTIFKSKSDLLTLNSVDDTNTSDTNVLFTDITTELGFTPVDEKGQAIVYTQDADGLKRYIQDTLAQYPQMLVKKEFDTFFAENKDLYKAYLHKIKTGSLEGYNVTVNWEDFDIDNASESELETLYVAYRKSLGDDEDTIKELVSAAKTNKNLAVKGKIAQKYFADKQTAEEVGVKQKMKDDAKAAEDAAITYNNSVREVITNGTIKIEEQEYKIPEVIKVVKGGVVKQFTRNDFADYIFTPKQFTHEGQKYNMTQYQYDTNVNNAKRNHNHDVYEAYLAFTGGNVDQLVKRTLASEKHQRTVKKLTATSTKSNPGGGGGKPVMPIK